MSGRRRLVAAMVLATAVLAAVGCQPPPPSEAPTISASIVAPSPVVAGGAMTITVTATHAEGVAHAEAQVFTPSGSRLPWQSQSCGAMGTTVTPQPGVTTDLTMSCVLPAFATNGTWVARVFVRAPGSAARQVDVPFDVVGGSDDDDPPAVQVISAPGGPVAAGASFAYRFRVTEPHPVVPSNVYVPSFTLDPQDPMVHVSFGCDQPTVTPVADGVVDVDLSCPVPVGQRAGTYTVDYRFSDALDQTTVVPLTVAVS